MQYADLISFEYAATVGGVNITVIKALVAKEYLKWEYAERDIVFWDGYSRTADGHRLHTRYTKRTRAVPSKDVIGLSSQWISVSDAADVADMETPRGMYNRVLKNQVRYIRAPDGEAFHVDGQKGLKILVDAGSVEPNCRY